MRVPDRVETSTFSNFPYMVNSMEEKLRHVFPPAPVDERDDLLDDHVVLVRLQPAEHGQGEVESLLTFLLECL